MDNDDGSRFYYVANNVVAYGGMKNFLGVDKTWSANLIVYPDRMWGDPCAMLWGGSRNIFANNTCLLGRSSSEVINKTKQIINKTNQRSSSEVEVRDLSRLYRYIFEIPFVHLYID